MLRTDLRELVRVALVKAGTDAGRRVFVPRDWPTQGAEYPCILVQTPREVKVSKWKGQPEFDTTVTVSVTGRVQGGTPEQAEGFADQLGNQIEQAVLTDFDLIRSIEQFTTVITDIRVSNDGEYHIGEVQVALDLQVFQVFEPTDNPANTASLNNLRLHLDAINPYDATGSYSSEFPASVTTAPRTSGPDGRDEGGLNLDLT